MVGNVSTHAAVPVKHTCSPVATPDGADGANGIYGVEGTDSGAVEWANVRTKAWRKRVGGAKCRECSPTVGGKT